MSRNDVKRELLSHPRILAALAALVVLLVQAQSAIAAGAGGDIGP